jgi:hypothetical protein
VATHYETLGVAPDADIETVRRAYVAVAKANHPDRRQAEDESRRDRAEQRMRAANAAWHVLRDPGRRAAYDRSLRPPSTGRPASSGGWASTGSAAATPASGPGAVGARPAPPSGIVVPASQASFWRFAPVIVLLAVLAIVLVVSAYATSGGSAPSSTIAPEVAPTVGDCVLLVSTGGRVAPVPVSCGTQGSVVVAAVVDTPRPCPADTKPIALADAETTLCLRSVS